MRIFPGHETSMRLICELCDERGLATVINIHDVALAQMFVRRIVGLRMGEIVFDGPPDTMTAETLTEIYGEEDWSATIRKVDEDVDEEDTSVDLSEQHTAVADRDRLAGLT